VIALADAEAAERLAAIHSLAFGRGWSAADFAKLLRNPTAFALECEEGFILAWSAADEAEILTVAVLPGARRKGLGLALTEACAAAAHARGASFLHLEVAENNFAARALYAKLGFVETGRRPNYYSDGAAAVTMRVRLPLPQ
jgi:ribosomal-protein-alanine N-acetyltransferase